MTSRSLSLLFALLIYGSAIGIGAGGAYYVFSSMFFTPVNESAKPQSFIVEPGMGIRKIAEKLEKDGLVKNWWSFYALHRFKTESGESEKDIKIFPGEYSISASMKPAELLEVFVKGEVVYKEFTIPEGYSTFDIPEVMAKTGLVSLPEVKAALMDTRTIARFRIPAKTLEGYLFPSTYKFTRPDNAEKMVVTMLEEGRKKITSEMKSRALELGLSFHQVVTLASIIEKETGAPHERKKISSVFHNRLRISMPLQTDPTVIYGILVRDGKFDGNLRKKDLTTPGVYNTYLNQGLPPTPISNPGIASIDAALYPEDTDFLYFVSKGDGTHIFSATYKEHLRAVNQYQRGRVVTPPSFMKKKSKVEEEPAPPPEIKEEEETVPKKMPKNPKSKIITRRGSQKRKGKTSQLEFE